MLDKLLEYQELQTDSFQVLKASLREELGNVNTTVLDVLEESEHDATYVAYKQRRDHEKAIRDPDDCYLMVLEREKELQEQGRPSQIKVIFGTGEAVRDEIMDLSFTGGDNEELEPESEQRFPSTQTGDGHEQL
jgi:hypothetical protein